MGCLPHAATVHDRCVRSPAACMMSVIGNCVDLSQSDFAEGTANELLRPVLLCARTAGMFEKTPLGVL